MKNLDIVKEIKFLLEEMVSAGLIIDPAPAPAPAPGHKPNPIIEKDLDKKQKELLEKYKQFMWCLHKAIGDEFLKVYSQAKNKDGEDKEYGGCQPGVDNIVPVVGYIATRILGEDAMKRVERFNRRLAMEEDTIFIGGMTCISEDDLIKDLDAHRQEHDMNIFTKDIIPLNQWLNDDSKDRSIVENAKKLLETKKEESEKRENVLLKTKKMIELSEKIKNKIDSVIAVRRNTVFFSSRDDASHSLEAFVRTLKCIQQLMLEGDIRPDEAESDIKQLVKQMLGCAGISEMCDRRRSCLRGAFNDIRGKIPEKVLLLAECIRLSGVTLQDIPQERVPKMLKKALSRRDEAVVTKKNRPK